MYKKFGKRLIDIFFSLVGLPFLLLIIVFVAPIIVIDDGFPIFYTSIRRGKDCRGFRMLKFRSMKNNSPDYRTNDNETYNAKDDPRLTKVGKVLRELSIDELPQLLNVLLGHMSFIGPRPCIQDKSFEELDDIERKIATVRPGITGYNQAYYRNSVSKMEKFAHDAYYVENLSFLMDIKILLKTITSIVVKKNIYNGENTND